MLTAQYSIHPVLSSCLVTIVLSFIPFVGSNHQRLGFCFIGSFAGMSNQSLSNFDFLVLTIFIFITIFALRDKFLGFGGKLGTTAFISSLAYLTFTRVIL